jgi:hypothetical protein
LNIEAAVKNHVTNSNLIVAEAMALAKEFARVFADLSGIRPPVFFPNQATYTPSQGAITLPPDPDASRLNNANTALAGLDGEIANFGSNIVRPMNRTLGEFKVKFDGVRDKVAELKALAEAIAIPQANEFYYTEGEYDDELHRTLKEVITSEIDKDPNGHSEEVEAAMYDQYQERREIVRQRETDDAMETTAGRGFTLPQGFHMEAAYNISEKYRVEDEKRAKDIFTLQSKFSLENKWKIIDHGITFNQIVFAYNDTRAQRALDAALAVLNLGLDAMKFRIEIGLKRLSLTAAEIEAIGNDRKISIEQYATTLIRFSKKIDGLMAKAKAYIESYRTEGTVYGIKVAAAAEESYFNQSENTISLEVQKANILQGIALAQDALKASVATANLKLGAASAGAAVHKADAMSALGSLGTVVNVVRGASRTTGE